MVNLVKRRIHLYGDLAEKFGAHFDIAVKSPAEAVRLLEANFPGEFLHLIRDRSFHIVVGDYDEENQRGQSITTEMTTFQFPKGDFHFIPVMQGAGGAGKGKGILMVIIGVALIATAFIGAAVFAGGAVSGLGASVFGGGLLGGVTWGNIALFGAAIALSGVASLLTPTPKDNKVEATGDSRKQSFFFNGAVNITEEGTPVPLLYGRLQAGSVVASGGIWSEKLDPYSNSADLNKPKTVEEILKEAGFGPRNN